MKRLADMLDKYSFYVWAIVILLVATIVLIPFIPGIFVTVFGFNIYYTPALIVSPVLMGIIYAVLVSYETPKMPLKKKKVFRTIKLVDVIVFYAMSIAVIITAAVRGNINF